MNGIGDVARDAGIAVIEDAAQAVGASDVERVGAWGDAGCFSKKFHGSAGRLAVNVYAFGKDALRDPFLLHRLNQPVPLLQFPAQHLSLT